MKLCRDNSFIRIYINKMIFFQMFSFIHARHNRVYTHVTIVPIYQLLVEGSVVMQCFQTCFRLHRCCGFKQLETFHRSFGRIS